MAGLLAEIKHSGELLTNLPFEIDLFEQPQRDSNPCLHLERASRGVQLVGSQHVCPAQMG